MVGPLFIAKSVRVLCRYYDKIDRYLERLKRRRYCRKLKARSRRERCIEGVIVVTVLAEESTSFIDIFGSVAVYKIDNDTIAIAAINWARPRLRVISFSRR